MAHYTLQGHLCFLICKNKSKKGGLKHLSRCQSTLYFTIYYGGLCACDPNTVEAETYLEFTGQLALSNWRVQ